MWRVLVLMALLAVPVYAGTPKEDRATRLTLLERSLVKAKEAQTKAGRAHDAWINRDNVALLPKEAKASSLRSGRQDWFDSLGALSEISQKLYGTPVSFKWDPDRPELGDSMTRIKLLVQRIEAEIRTVNDDIARDP